MVAVQVVRDRRETDRRVNRVQGWEPVRNGSAGESERRENVSRFPSPSFLGKKIFPPFLSSRPSLPKRWLSIPPLSRRGRLLRSRVGS
jgi:hypothetical protein